jgi:hypothetical protein
MQQFLLFPFYIHHYMFRPFIRPPSRGHFLVAQNIETNLIYYMDSSQKIKTYMQLINFWVS